MGGLLGNSAHWAVGVAVKQLGAESASPRAYYPLYYILATMMLLSLGGLPCLHAIRRRERLESHPASDRADAAAHNPPAALK
jgi:hypothetical protein